MSRHHRKINPVRTISDAIAWADDYWSGRDGAIVDPVNPRATKALLVPAGIEGPGRHALDADTILIEVEEIMPPNWYVVTRDAQPEAPVS